MPFCNNPNCEQPIKWPQPYQKGQRPLNLDGSVHVCGESTAGEVASPQTDNNTSSATTEKPLVIEASKRVKIVITVEVIPE